MRVLKVLCFVSVIVFALAFAPVHLNQSDSGKLVSGGYQIGDTAEDFKLKNIDGKYISLSDYSNKKGVMVIFTCNSCPFAKAYEDRIIALDKKYAGKGVPVVAINPNNPDVKSEDSFDMMKVKAKEKGYTFPYLFDESQTVYPKFGATKTPHVFLLENTTKGAVVKYIGAIDDNAFDATAVKVKYLEDAVDSMLKGDEIKTKSTKAIGCTIKV